MSRDTFADALPPNVLIGDTGSPPQECHTLFVRQWWMMDELSRSFTSFDIPSKHKVSKEKDDQFWSIENESVFLIENHHLYLMQTMLCERDESKGRYRHPWLNFTNLLAQMWR